MQHAFGLVNKFIEVCPDDIWNKTFGGWPVWEQIAHCFTTIDFFIRPKDAKEDNGPFAPEVSHLDKKPLPAPDKAAFKAYADKMQAAALAYAGKVDDAGLGQKNEGLSARMQNDTTVASTLALIAAHTMYHLGSCDAALRESGRPGVF
jgi:uncharacterized damage-inducible protein DinB